MSDHGFIPLGKYSSARDSILHYLCTSEWANESFGDVESPTGYVWRISNTLDDVLGNTEIDSILEPWFEENNEVTDSRSLRRELVGHYLVSEDSNGLVFITEYPSQYLLIQAFNSIREVFDAWDAQDDENE